MGVGAAIEAQMGCLSCLETAAPSHLLVPQDGPLLQLMQQPVLLSDTATALTKIPQLVGAEVDLQVAFLSSSVVTVGALEGLLSCVCAHVQGQDAVKTEALATQWTGILPILAGIIFDVIHLGHDAQVLAIEKLLQVNTPIQPTQCPCINVSVELIG